MCILFLFDLQCELKEKKNRKKQQKEKKIIKKKKKYSGTTLNSVSPGQALKLIQA